MDFGCGCDQEEDLCICKQAKPVDLNILDQMPDTALTEPCSSQADDDAC